MGGFLLDRNKGEGQFWESTPPKTNMEAKNEGLEDDFPFQRCDFQVPC